MARMRGRVPGGVSVAFQDRARCLGEMGEASHQLPWKGLALFDSSSLKGEVDACSERLASY